ncbi:DMT family transporter [Undibacterium curvum]|jgi:S-adenosylmethionine uptake transporter|uniref:DMT family transporter n=1 Tax=Undibacterium curvum TaxID=2762294 RepID=UPI003D134ED9
MQSLWMLVASLLFSLMGVCVKLASDHYATAEIVSYRGLIGSLLLLALIRVQRGTLRTAMPGSHLWRGLVGVAALWMWFYAIGRLPLAMAVTLNYMSAVWIAAFLFLRAWRLREQQLDWRLVAAILLGFGGVILLLRPTIHADQWLGGVIALVSGMLAALAYLQVRQMGVAGEPEYRVVFYFSLTCAVAGFLGVSLSALAGGAGWHAHTGQGALLLLAIGITAALAQMAMTRAYRLGNTLLTANLQYLGIVFSSIWDVLIWHDSLSWLSWAGIVVILCSGCLASFYNARNSPAKVAPDPIATE